MVGVQDHFQRLLFLCLQLDLILPYNWWDPRGSQRGQLSITIQQLSSYPYVCMWSCRISPCFCWLNHVESRRNQGLSAQKIDSLLASAATDHVQRKSLGANLILQDKKEKSPKHQGLSNEKTGSPHHFNGGHVGRPGQRPSPTWLFHRAVHKAMITQQMCWRQNNWLPFSDFLFMRNIKQP